MTSGRDRATLPPGPQGRLLPVSSCSWWLRGPFGLWPHHCNLRLCLHVASPVLSLIRTLVIGSRAHQDHPGNLISRSLTQLPLQRPFFNSGHMPRCQGFGHTYIWGTPPFNSLLGFLSSSDKFNSIKTLGKPMPGVTDSERASTESMAGGSLRSLGGAGGRSSSTAKVSSRCGPEEPVWRKAGLGRAGATRRHPTSFCGGFDV